MSLDCYFSIKYALFIFPHLVPSSLFTQCFLFKNGARAMLFQKSLLIQKNCCDKSSSDHSIADCCYMFTETNLRKSLFTSQLTHLPIIL